MPPNRPSRLSLEDCKAHAERLDGKCLSSKYTNKRTHMLWECGNGHQWCATFGNVRIGHWCRRCFNLTQRLDLPECKETAKLMGGLCLSEAYIGNNKKMLWQCEFGHQWSGKYEHIKNGHWCPVCVGRGKYTIDDCIRIAEEKGGKCLATEYRLVKEKIRWQCSIGHIWKASFDKIVSGSWCNKCRTHRIENCADFAKAKGGRCLSTEYITNKLPLIWECEKGHTWSCPFTDTVNKDQWCAVCNEELRLKKWYEKCVSHAIAKKGLCLSTAYISSLSKMQWSCHKGHIWFAAFSDLNNGDHWCPTCGLVISKPQIKIHSAISNHFPNLEVILNDTKIIKPMDLDIFIPSLSIGIEYDGEYWHHSDWAVSKGSLEKMAIKNARCKSLGIKLIRIREKDFKSDETMTLNSVFDFIQNNIELNGE